jgi:hypothetical protein
MELAALIHVKGFKASRLIVSASPDRVQFDNGTIWHRDLGLPPPPRHRK